MQIIPSDAMTYSVLVCLFEHVVIAPLDVK